MIPIAKPNISNRRDSVQSLNKSTVLTFDDGLKYIIDHGDVIEDRQIDGSLNRGSIRRQETALEKQRPDLWIIRHHIASDGYHLLFHCCGVQRAGFSMANR